MQEKPFFIYHTSKIQKLSGLRPGPRWGSSRRSPRPPSRVGRAPLPTPLPLGAFGTSLSGGRHRRLFKIHKRTPLFKILDPSLRYMYAWVSLLHAYLRICEYMYLYVSRYMHVHVVYICMYV